VPDAACLLAPQRQPIPPRLLEPWGRSWADTAPAPRRYDPPYYVGFQVREVSASRSPGAPGPWSAGRQPPDRRLAVDVRWAATSSTLRSEDVMVIGVDPARTGRAARATARRRRRALRPVRSGWWPTSATRRPLVTFPPSARATSPPRRPAAPLFSREAPVSTSARRCRSPLDAHAGGARWRRSAAFRDTARLRLAGRSRPTGQVQPGATSDGDAAVTGSALRVHVLLGAGPAASCSRAAVTSMPRRAPGCPDAAALVRPAGAWRRVEPGGGAGHPILHPARAPRRRRPAVLSTGGRHRLEGSGSDDDREARPSGQVGQVVCRPS